MSQSSGCTTNMFQITGPTGTLSAIAQSFVLSWSKTPSSFTCASEAIVKDTSATWISPQTATATGTDGSATYTIQANTVSPRSTTILVGSISLGIGSPASVFSDGTTFTVTQGAAGGIKLVSGGNQSASPGQAFSLPVVFQVVDTSQNPIAGATVNFSVTSGSATLTNTSVTSNAQGQVSVNVTAGNTAGPITITAAYATFTASASLTVTGCTYTLSQLSPSSFPASGGTGSVTLSVAGSGSCPISAPITSTFITINTAVPSSLGGGASVALTFTVAPNNSTGALTGTITIAGQTVSITEAGVSSCSITLSPTSVNFGALGGVTGQKFTVNAPSGCAWTASTTASFLSIASGASGNGNGTVTYSVAAETTNPATTRQGAINVTGTSGFTVNQVVPILSISSGSPSSNCAAPASQKYFLQNSSIAIYPWFASAPGNSSDVVTDQLYNSAGAAVGTPGTLGVATGCFFSQITFSNPSPATYSLQFSLNGALAGSLPFVIVQNQVSLNTSGALSPLPGLNQESIQATLPNAFPDAATVALTPAFSPSGVANAATSAGAYDCRFVPQSGASVTIPAAQTQSASSTVSGGTVAGTCSIGVTGVSVPGFNYSPSANAISIANTPSASATPNIANGVIQQSAAGNSTLTLQVTGYSMTRDLSSIAFTFTPLSGFTLGSPTVTANVQSQAVTWYTSAGSAVTGGQFQYTQSFNIGSGTSANLSSVTVTVTSTTGSSPPVTISLH
jgi:hypothetical protein